MTRRILALTLALLAAVARPGPAGEGPTATRNVVLVTTDGLRPEEFFAGADAALLNKQAGGVADVEALRREFWRDTPEARREALLPFVWGMIAPRGQLFGNTARGSPARVANGKNFSYPGYNELLTGTPDPRIDSNAKRPNPNVTVLEWLHSQPEYRGKVAAFTSWDVFPFILNRERSGLVVNSGWEPITGESLNEKQEFLNALIRDTPRLWPDSRLDAYTFHAALEHLLRQTPRVLYIALGETDTFAHQGRYDLYLRSAHRADAHLKHLWDTLQAHPSYRGTTTLIVTTDHGRGPAPVGWKSHGANVPGAEQIWIGILGPDTPALGERSNVEPVTQGQVAATLAALLGQDFRAAFPRAAPPLPDTIRAPAPR